MTSCTPVGNRRAHRFFIEFEGRELNRTTAQASARDASRVARYTIAPVVIAIALGWDWLTGGIGPQLVLGTTDLTFSTTPAEAVVLIDGERVGHTPLVVEDVLAGERVVRFQHPFHEPVIERFQAVRDEPGQLTVVFEPVETSLLIASNPKGATVTFNGVLQDGEAPLELDTPTGRYEVTLELAGRQSATIEVDVLPGEENAVSVDLERKPLGTLLIDVEPTDARVRVAGEPYVRGMRLEQGRHQVVVSAPGFLTKRERMDVTEGLNQHSISLATAISRLSITAQPTDAEVIIKAGNRRTARYVAPLDVPFGPVRVTVRAKDHQTFRAKWNINEPTTVKRVRLPAQRVTAGRRFSDPLSSGGTGPELIVISSGSFGLGIDDGPPDEGPRRTVELYESFALGIFEVTQGEYARFDTERAVDPDSASFPVNGIEWASAVAYTRWLSTETGHRYRLPSEVEWEYAARAGTSTPLYAVFDGPRLDGVCVYENVRDQSMREYARTDAVICSDGFKELAPVGSFQPNPWGLYDMIGNVAEWVSDCWYERHPGPRLRAGPREEPACHTWVVRGGSWLTPSQDIRATLRIPGADGRIRRGFRVVREL